MNDFAIMELSRQIGVEHLSQDATELVRLFDDVSNWFQQNQQDGEKISGRSISARCPHDGIVIRFSVSRPVINRNVPMSLGIGMQDDMNSDPSQYRRMKVSYSQGQFPNKTTETYWILRPTDSQGEWSFYFQDGDTHSPWVQVERAPISGIIAATRLVMDSLDNPQRYLPK